MTWRLDPASVDALVVGAGGFVGRHLMPELRNQGYNALGVDDPDVLAGDWPPTPTIFSLAATADPKAALADPEGCYVNDVRIAVQVMEHARKVGARVLHVSTNEVYGHDGLGPLGPYAGGKACQDVIVGSYRDVESTIVVTQSLFGELQQPDKLMPAVIAKLLAGEPVPLQRDGEMYASRPFMHVQNLVDGLLYLDDMSNGEVPRRVHVGMDKAYNVHFVVKVLAEALGVEANIVAVPAGDRPGHELYVTPICCDVPGWQPGYPTVRALRAMAANAMKVPA